MHRTGPDTSRALGSPRPPRRRFVAPTAVRLAQVCIGLRIGTVVGFAAAAAAVTLPTVVVLPGDVRVDLPGSTTWSAAAPALLAAALVEAILIVRLSSLRTGSRRVILVLESALLAVAGLYVAAGFAAALMPFTCAVAAVTLLRLDHVRHSFNRAGSERRLMGSPVRSQLYSGYGFDEPTSPPRPQGVGYRRGIDYDGSRPVPATRSRT